MYITKLASTQTFCAKVARKFTKTGTRRLFCIFGSGRFRRVGCQFYGLTGRFLSLHLSNTTSLICPLGLASSEVPAF